MPGALTEQDIIELSDSPPTLVRKACTGRLRCLSIRPHSLALRKATSRVAL